MTKTAQKTLGGQIRAFREESGMSLDDLVYEIRFRHGRKITKETLRYYEVVKPDEDSIDFELFVEIADVLGRDPGEFTDAMTEKAKNMLALLGKSRICRYAELIIADAA